MSCQLVFVQAIFCFPFFFSLDDLRQKRNQTASNIITHKPSHVNISTTHASVGKKLKSRKIVLMGLLANVVTNHL